MLQLQPWNVLASCGRWAVEILLKFFKVWFLFAVCCSLYMIHWMYQYVAVCFHSVTFSLDKTSLCNRSPFDFAFCWLYFADEYISKSFLSSISVIVLCNCAKRSTAFIHFECLYYFNVTGFFYRKICRKNASEFPDLFDSNYIPRWSTCICLWERQVSWMVQKTLITIRLVLFLKIL